jgi:hypothetical protein
MAIIIIIIIIINIWIRSEPDWSFQVPSRFVGRTLSTHTECPPYWTHTHKISETSILNLIRTTHSSIFR